MKNFEVNFATLLGAVRIFLENPDFQAGNTKSCAANTRDVEHRGDEQMLAEFQPPQTKFKAADDFIRPLKCPKCPASFALQYHFDMHVLRAHEKPLKCRHCERKYERQRFLEDHERKCVYKKENRDSEVTPKWQKT